MAAPPHACGSSVCHGAIYFDVWQACLLEQHNERDCDLKVGDMKPEAAGNPLGSSWTLCGARGFMGNPPSCTPTASSEPGPSPSVTCFDSSMSHILEDVMENSTSLNSVFSTLGLRH